jgi:hypothetical protein
MNSVATTYVGLRSKGDICGPAPAYGSIGKVQAAAHIRMINEHGGINGQGQSHSVSTKSSPPSSFPERTECPLCATGREICSARICSLTGRCQFLLIIDNVDMAVAVYKIVKEASGTHDTRPLRLRDDRPVTLNSGSHHSAWIQGTHGALPKECRESRRTRCR